MRKEGVLVVECLKDASVCSWMNLGAMCWVFMAEFLFRK